MGIIHRYVQTDTQTRLWSVRRVMATNGWSAKAGEDESRRGGGAQGWRGETRIRQGGMFLSRVVQS